jgi:hypothetical protein
MRPIRRGFVLPCGLLLLSTSGHADQSLYRQVSEAHTDVFEGSWIGSGSAPNTIRHRCGFGPKVELTVRGSAVEALLKLPIRKGRSREFDIIVIPLNGSIDDQGDLELAGYESRMKGSLSAGDRSGEGTWNIITFKCHGSFRVRKKP